MKNRVKENYNIDELDDLFKRIVKICNRNDCEFSMFVNYKTLFNDTKETYYKVLPNNIKRTLKDISSDNKE